MTIPSHPTSDIFHPGQDSAAGYTLESIIWLRYWTPHLISFRLSRNPAYRFVPGQFARIGLAKSAEEPVWRPYSIVSTPADPYLEFFSVIVPGGEFSSRLVCLKQGDKVLLEKRAQGFLTTDRFDNVSGGRDIWLIATGTGLAPFVSMVGDPRIWQRFDHVVIVQTVRDRRDLAYGEELSILAEDIAKNHPGKLLQHIKTLTREMMADALHGRVTTLIESGELERTANFAMSDHDSRFMLCGNPQMVEDVRNLLKTRGFRMNRKMQPGHIVVENYW